jgi:hypothetical protein
MGLDISFNRKKALAAGIEVQISTRGTQDEILAAFLNDDPAGYSYLAELITLVRVPGMKSWIEDDGYEDYFAVRANKWGRTYTPLTNWLKAHDIPWDEY